MPQQVFSVPELAKYWRVSVQTLRLRIGEGSLRAFNVNTAGKRPKWRIYEADAEAYRLSRSNVPKQPRRAKVVKPVREYV